MIIWPPSTELDLIVNAILNNGRAKMLAKIKSNGAFCLIKKLFSAFALHTRIWPFSPFTFTFCLAVSTEIMSMSDAIAFVLKTLYADIAKFLSHNLYQPLFGDESYPY